MGEDFAQHGFVECFQAITGGRTPFKWQRRLWKRFGAGNVPSACCLPTGLGKTSVIPIWLLALAGGAALPRRLVYIVNRRTVVDQATDEAEKLLARLYRSGCREHLAWANEDVVKALGRSTEPVPTQQHAASIAMVRKQLARLAGDDAKPPLAVSALRGELADNGEWKKNPARPAIIIGTIDMIGSKLLFSGYGDGRYGRAHHAGLIGQDALIVHDEAHLSPAFDVLLRSVAAEQVRCGESRPIRVMSLSATMRTGNSGGTEAGSPFGIEDEDRLDPVVSQRLGARKSLTIVDADKGTVVPKTAEQALGLGASSSRVLVYVRSPDAVAKIAEAIEKGLGNGGGTRVARLTGTIRGKERDQLAESEVFRAFKAGADRSSSQPHALYLVCTSAGEVGADLDADHLVCDLSTLDSMAQRFGRVNRLGGDGRSARIVVVRDEIPDKDPLAMQRRNTAEVLKDLPAIKNTCESVPGHDASPAALSALLAKPEAKAAFSPMPKILPATDILFDHWSLTSIAGEMPGRPEVGPYLHGVAEWEPPETHVAWRADIALLAAAGGKDQNGKDQPCADDDIEEVFDAFPLHSTELLRDRTDRVQAELQKIAERLKEGAQHRAASPSADNADSEGSNNTSNEAEGEGEVTKEKDKSIEPNPWVVLMRGGSLEWVRLEDIAPVDNDDAKRVQRRLAFATVVLPAEAGGLRDGMLKGDESAPADARSLDVAEVARDDAEARQRTMDGQPLLGGGAIVGIAHATISLARDGDEDSEPATLEYRVAKGQDREPGERMGLSAHNDAVASAAERVAKALGLDDPAIRAIALAGRLHDRGKDRTIWQRFANNIPHRDKPGGPIAKSDRYGHWKQLAGYRHEFGSLHDASTDDKIRSFDPDTRDLVLHLIAAHHGWARPHFELRHFDPGDPSPGKPRPTADNERQAIETMQCFARLQQRYGRWGLAWLESILRCVDAEASESSAPTDTGAGTGGKRKATPGGAA